MYTIRKTYKLSQLLALHAFPSTGFIQFTFSQRSLTSGEVHLAFEIRSAATALEVLAAVDGFCHTHEGILPRLYGVGREQLEEIRGSSGSSTTFGVQTNAPFPSLTALAGINNNDNNNNQQSRDGVMSTPARHGRTGSSFGGRPGSAMKRGLSASFSKREDQHIKSLLDTVSGIEQKGGGGGGGLSSGNASVAQLQDRLEAELAALEEANVHGILENGPLVNKVVGDLHSALLLLDDLEESLNIFDTKLGAMKEDIAAIEERNNALEIAASNNRKLEASLRMLLDAVELPVEAQRELQAVDVKMSRIDAVVAAGWELHSRLTLLNPQQQQQQHTTKNVSPAGGTTGTDDTAAESPPSSSSPLQQQQPLPPSLLNMAAVSHRRQTLQQVVHEFLPKILDLIEEQLQVAADDELVQVSSQRGPAKLHPVNRTKARARLNKLIPLVAVAGALQPSSMGTIQDFFSQAMGSIVTKELKHAVSELRKYILGGGGGLSGMASLSSGLRSLSLEKSRSVSRLSSMKQGSSRIATSGGGGGGGGGDQLSTPTMMPLYAAYKMLLDNFLPSLHDEADFCIRFLFPTITEAGGGRGGGGGLGGGGDVGYQSEAAEQLLKGTDSIMLSLATQSDTSSSSGGGLKNSALFSLPMLGTTLAWKSQLQVHLHPNNTSNNNNNSNNNSRQKTAAVVAIINLLKNCETELRRMFSSFQSEFISNIKKQLALNDDKTAGGVKSVHILQPAMALAAVVSALHDVLEESWMHELKVVDDGVVEGKTVSTNTEHACTTVANPRAALLQSPFELASSCRNATTPINNDNDKDEDEAKTQPPVNADKHEIAAELLKVGQLFTHFATDALFKVIEDLAATDTKHGQRLRLENYDFFLSNISRDNNVLVCHKAFEVAGTRKHDAMEEYVAQQLEYLKLGGGGGVDGGGLEKKASQARQRVSKHFRSNSGSDGTNSDGIGQQPTLEEAVWQCLSQAAGF